MALKQELVRNNLIIMGSGVVVAAVSFVVTIALARLLQPVEFGLYSLALTITGLLMIFTDLGMGATMVRYISNSMDRGEAGSARALVGIFLRYRIALLLAVGGALLAAPETIASAVFQKPEAGQVVFLAGALLMLNSLEEFLRTVLNGLKQFGAVSAVSVLGKVAQAALALGLVIAGWGVFGALAGLLFASVLSIAAAAWFIRRRTRGWDRTGSRLDRRSILRFGIWASAWSIIVTVFASADITIISILGSVTDIGFYRIAVTWAAALATFFPISATVLYPYFSAAGDGGQRMRIVATALRYGLLVMFPLAILGSAFAGAIVASFYGASYLPAEAALRLLILSAVPVLFTTVTTYYFSGIERPDIPAKITGAMLAVTVVLVALAFPFYGIAGAAAATLTARCGEAVAMGAAARRHRVPLPAGAILKPFAAALVVGAAATQLALPTIPHLVAAGLALLGAYAGILFVLRGLTREDLRLLSSIVLRRGA